MIYFSNDTQSLLFTQNKTSIIMDSDGFLLPCILLGHHGSKFVVFLTFISLLLVLEQKIRQISWSS